MFRSFILIVFHDGRIFSYNDSLNPFVQVFYSNALFLALMGYFVQVFYSNALFLALMGYDGYTRLNPFVQVFYSNKNLKNKVPKDGKKVLIPLFRSFILIFKQNKGKNFWICNVLIPLFRSFILIPAKSGTIGGYLKRS